MTVEMWTELHGKAPELHLKESETRLYGRFFSVRGLGLAQHLT